MSVLTENIVLVRTRSHDLNSVKKLNCWGCALKDVSIVHRMPNVEVISLSINNIDTLENFASCSMLQELYLRKNEIKNINEILYLSQLQYLKKLSLEDNPCTGLENYRFTVLKTLPNLEYLDNIRVTPEEIYQAEKLGRDLIWPGTENDFQEEEEDEVKEIQQQPEVDYESNLSQMNNLSLHDSQASLSYASQTSGSVLAAAQDTTNYSCQSSEDSTYQCNSNQSQTNGNITNRHSTRGSGSGSHLITSGTTANGTTVNNNNTKLENCTHSNGNPSKPRTTNMAKSSSLSDYNLYNNGTLSPRSSAFSDLKLTGNYCISPPPPPLSATTYEPSEYCYDHGPPMNQAQAYNGSNYQHNGSNRSMQGSASSSQPRLLPKGGKNRNANILSAVLCLIKELDYGSLEVVDTTIHCRMEEMED